MPVSEIADEMQIAKSKKVIALTKGVALVLLVFSLLSTSVATFLILESQKETSEAILDCVLPTGACYRDKIQSVNVITVAEVNLIVNYCYDQTPTSLEKARACIDRELEKR